MSRPIADRGQSMSRKRHVKKFDSQPEESRRVLFRGWSFAFLYSEAQPTNGRYLSDVLAGLHPDVSDAEQPEPYWRDIKCHSDDDCYVVGCGVDCHAMNFQPFGIFVQASRNTSLRLRGWPLISASIAARPVTSAASPARRTLRSLQAALLYFVFPERREASHVALVSVSPEEWV